jgi:phosphotransacetylase
VVDAHDALSRQGALAAATAGLILPVVMDHRRIADAVGDAMIMKGAAHSDVPLRTVLREPRLRTDRRLSHIVVTEISGRAAPLLLSDGAVNIAPDLDAKAQSCRTAIDAAHKLGIEQPARRDTFGCGSRRSRDAGNA